MLDFETLQLLVEHFPDLVSVVDGDGIFEYVNPAHTTILGFEAQDILGTPALDLIHPDDRPAAAIAIVDMYEGSGDLGGVPIRLRTKAGSWVPMYVDGNAFAKLDGSGKAVFVSHPRDPLENASGGRTRTPFGHAQGAAGNDPGRGPRRLAKREHRLVQPEPAEDLGTDRPTG